MFAITVLYISTAEKLWYAGHSMAFILQSAAKKRANTSGVGKLIIIVRISIIIPPYNNTH